MADIAVKVQLQITTPGQAFGVKQTDPFGQTYQAAALATQPTAALSNVLVIPEVDVAILCPSPVLADNTLAQFNFPLGETWVKNRDASNNCLGILQNSAANGLSFEADTAATYPGGNGFCCRIGRGQANGADSTGANYYTELTWGVDTPPVDAPDGAVPVRLMLIDGQPPFAQYATASDDGSSWQWGAYGENGTGSTQISDSSQLFANAGRAIDITVLVFQPYNAIVIDIKGQDRLILQAPNQTAQVAGSGVTYTQGPGITTNSGAIKLTGQNGTCSFQVFSLGFATSGAITSGAIQLPFVYQGNGTVVSPGIILPDGCGAAFEIDGASDDGTYVSYTASLTGPSTATPCVSQLSLFIPPTFVYTPGAGAVIAIDETDMSEVQVHRWLEFHQTPDNGFAVYPRCQVGIKFNTTYGQFSGGTFARHWAVTLSTATEVWNADVGAYELATPYFTQITGWTGMSTDTWRADPTRRFDLIIEDRTWPLRIAAEGSMPYFDGWCWRSAVAYVAMAGGVMPAFMDPLFFTCDMGPNPAGCTHFKLPVGAARNPRVYFQADRPYWDSIMEIAGMVHAVIGFAEGTPTTPATLTAMPYYPGVTLTPNRGTITTTDFDYGDENWLMTFIGQGLRVGTDTSDRRTGVALYGIDPSTHLIQGTFLNLSDLPGVDPDSGVPWAEFTTVAHGFPQPFVNISSFNVDPVFTAAYAANALLKLRMPTLKADWTTYYHPASFLLDQYTLSEPVALPSGPVAFSVESKLDRFAVLNWDGSVPSSTFSGRRVMNL